MASKIAMIKIAVLGEGGVGKTSLTIQVRVTHTTPPPFSRDLTPEGTMYECITLLTGRTR